MSDVNFMDILNPSTLVTNIIQTFTKKFVWPMPKESHVARIPFPTLIGIVLVLAILGYILFHVGNRK